MSNLATANQQPDTAQEREQPEVVNLDLFAHMPPAQREEFERYVVSEAGIDRSQIRFDWERGSIEYINTNSIRYKESPAERIRAALEKQRPNLVSGGIANVHTAIKKVLESNNHWQDTRVISANEGDIVAFRIGERNGWLQIVTERGEKYTQAVITVPTRNSKGYERIVIQAPFYGDRTPVETIPGLSIGGMNAGGGRRVGVIKLSEVPEEGYPHLQELIHEY